MSTTTTCARSGRVQAAAVLTILLATLAVAVPLDPSGDLDTSFSGDGKVAANFSNVLSFAEARGVAIQSSGKIVLGGSSVDGTNNHFALIRLNADGTQDMSFGEGGQTKTALGSFDLINDIAVQSDNKIVAAGFGTGTGDDFIIARYTVDGALDTTFAAPNGYLKVDFAGLQDRANALVIQDDGKIVVAGFRLIGSNDRDVALVRLNTNGTLDGTFGSGGKVVTAVSTATSPDDRAFAVRIVGSGASRKILAGGRTRSAGPNAPVLLLVQYTDSGALDSGFGTGGIQQLDIPGNCGGCGEEIRDLALQSDGKIVASGAWVTTTDFNVTTTMLTARFSATGAFDTTFDSDGWVITNVATTYFTDIGASVVVQADGKIITFGWSDQSDVDLIPADHDFIFVRLNADGSRDGTYGSGGPLPGVVLVELSDGNSFDDGDAMVLDSSGRAVGVGLRTTQTGNSFIGAARLTTSGALDTTFGPDGPDGDTSPDGFFTTQLIGGSRDEVGGMVIQPDGKTVVAGWTDVGSNSFDFAVARFNTDGTLDSGFGGGDGLANGSKASENDTGRAVGLQSDGKIVVVGDSYGSLTPSFTLMRFTTAGVLDSTFGTSGVATTTFGTNGNTPHAMAIQTADDKIVAGGSVSDAPAEWDFGLARFNADGTLDSGFGTGGKARLDFGGPSVTTFDEIHAILIQPDNKIVVGGRASSGSHFYFALARYNANGTLDTTFASPNGYFTVRISHSANTFAGDEIRGLLRLPDGRILAGGKALNASGLNAFALARFHPNGSLDTTLDGDGMILVNLGGNNQDEINGIALQSDEKVLAFGNSFSFTTGANDFGLARFNWDDGSLDTTYGTNGVVTTEFAGFDRAMGGTVLSNGKAVAAGTTGGNDFAAARYLGDPAPTVPGLPDLAAGSDSGASSTDNITNDNTPTIGGSCVTGETVVLKIDGAETVPRTRVRCVSSAYAFTTAALPDGVRTFTVFSINGAGSSTDSAGLAVTIDTVALAPTISAPAAAATVSPNPTISGGGGENGALVTVREGASTVCTDPADGTGAWSCVSSLMPASHTITAIQTDIAGNTSGASATRTFTVKAPTTTALTSSTNPTVFGQTVTFTATVSTAGFGTPDGTVDFVIDGGAAVAVSLVSGQASLPTSTLSVGAHSVTASYLGTTFYFASSDGPLAHTVNKANTTTNVASSANPSVFGQSVVLTATVAAVAPGAGTPTGTVTFKEGSTTLATVALNASGQAAFTSSTFSIGAHGVTAEYSGSSNFNASGPTGITQTVNKANTTTNVVSSLNPSVFGQSVTFTATVAAAAPGAGTPTGTVTFKDGATTLGTVTLNASGEAAFTTSTLSGGTHGVTAEYGGSGNFNSSGPTGITQTVDKANTTTNVVSSLNPSVFGQSVTLTATVAVVAPGAGTPTGTVTFKDGATTLGTASLDASGEAAFTTSTLSGGTHGVTAEYGGSGNFNASVSSGITQTVDKANTTTNLVSSVNPSVFGQPVTFTATVAAVAPGAGTPTGTVTFKDGATTLGTVTLNASGQAAFTSSTLSVGAHGVTAEYGSSGNFNASVSSGITQTVNTANTTTNLVSSVNPSVFGQSVTFTATVAAVAPGAGTPTGNVTFKDGATTLATVPLNASGQATFTSSTFSVGAHGVTAEYGGSGNFNASGPTGVTQTVDKANTTTNLISSVNPSVFGQSVALTATVAAIVPGAGTPTGNVTFKDGGTTLATVTLDASGQATFNSASFAVGSHAVTAEYGGDASFNVSGPTGITQTVNQAGTSTSLVSSNNPSFFSASVTFTATVSVGSPGAGTPTGNVTFKDGTTTLGTVALDASLQAAFTTSTLSEGSHSITAEYGGDGSFSPITSAPLTQTVDPSSDLRVTKDNGTSFVDPGDTTTYTIVVANLGPSGVTGATVSDVLPADGTNGTWTCVATGGGTCTAAGAGDISDTVDLPAGAAVTYTLMMDLVASPSSSTLSNTASASVPAGHGDPDSSNDAATDVDTFCLDPGTGCGNFYTVSPCRLVDTRNPAGPSGGPVLTAGATRNFPVGGLCGIPSDARVVAVNITVVNSTSLGSLTLFPAGSAQPVPPTISFSANRVRSSNALVPLGVSGQVAVNCHIPGVPSASTDFILDVMGYFK